MLCLGVPIQSSVGVGLGLQEFGQYVEDGGAVGEQQDLLLKGRGGGHSPEQVIFILLLDPVPLMS